MKQLTIIAITIILSMLILAFKSSPETKVKTVAFTSNNNIEIINTINKFSGYGYSVKFMVNQTIDISESRKFNSGSWDQINRSTSKGNIIVVMELKN